MLSYRAFKLELISLIWIYQFVYLYLSPISVYLGSVCQPIFIKSKSILLSASSWFSFFFFIRLFFSFRL